MVNEAGATFCFVNKKFPWFILGLVKLVGFVLFRETASPDSEKLPSLFVFAVLPYLINLTWTSAKGVPELSVTVPVIAICAMHWLVKNKRRISILNNSA